MAQHYVKIPKDFALIKQKFILGLTKRQVISFSIGAAIGFPAFYIFNNMLGLQAGCIALGIAAAPALFCGLYNKNGQHLEQKIKLMIEFFRKPKKRTYQSENMYSMLARQAEYSRLKKLLESSYEKK